LLFQIDGKSPDKFFRKTTVVLRNARNPNLFQQLFVSGSSAGKNRNKSQKVSYYLNMRPISRSLAYMTRKNNPRVESALIPSLHLNY